MKFNMTKIAAALVLTVAATGAQAAPVSSGGVFNMYSQDGLDQTGVLSGSEVAINVDNTISGFVDTAAGTWGVSSSALFYGLNWTASGGTLITTPGDFALDTTTGAITAAAPSAPLADGSMHFTVGAGQAAGAINFAWGATTGIRVVNVWNINSNGSLTAAAVPGMENGPFPGFNAAFNLNQGLCVLTDPCAYPPGEWPGYPVTNIPEASTYGMMLAGLGLVVIATRRRKLAKA